MSLGGTEMLPNQYGRKQFWLEAAGVLALGPILASWVMILFGTQEYSRGWMALAYFLGMGGMIILVIYFACSRSWHSDMQKGIERREGKTT